MNREEVERAALELFVAGGLHCAEVVSKTISEAAGSESVQSIPRVASGFGGGIGYSIADTCGALTGGIIALGCLYGRDEAGGNVERVMRMAGRFRERFLEKNGSTQCPVLLRQFKQQEDMMKCKKMTSEAAGMLAEIVNEELESVEDP